MTIVLADLCEAIVDCEHMTAPAGDGFALSVGTRAMKDGRLVVEACKPVSESTYEAWTRRMKPKPGDLVLAREAPVGQVIRVPELHRICLGQRTVLIRPAAAEVDSRFLHYWLLGPDAQSLMTALASGATVPHLNVEDIRTLDASPLPRDRRLQANAAAVLGAIDELIENNLRRIEILEEMAQAIYREWFVNFRYPGHEADDLVDSPLGPIPKGWSTGPLSELVENLRDSTNAGDHLLAKPYIPIDCIGGRTWVVRESKPGSQAKSSLLLFKSGDFLFGAMRPYFHKVAIAPRDGVTRSTCFVLRVVNDHLYHYALMVLFQESTISYAANHSRGTTIPYAVWDGSLADMLVLLPDHDTARTFGEGMRSIVELALNLAGQNTTLGTTRDLLLPKLVSGEIDVSGLDIDTSWLVA